MQAKAKLQSQKLGRVEESASYIDPITGSLVKLDANSQDSTSVSNISNDAMMTLTGDFYDRSIQDYYQANRYDIDTQSGSLYSDRTETYEGPAGPSNPDGIFTRAKKLTREEYEADLAAGKDITYQGEGRSRPRGDSETGFGSIEGRTLMYAMGADSLDDDLIGRGGGQTEGEKVAVGQAKLSFQQLAATALQARMQSLGSELTLRQQAAKGELESRRKANANVSDLEKKRVQQVDKITSSINDINSLFALQDSKFLAAENQQADNGVDFRSERPQ